MSGHCLFIEKAEVDMKEVWIENLKKTLETHIGKGGGWGRSSGNDMGGIS